MISNKNRPTFAFLIHALLCFLIWYVSDFTIFKEFSDLASWKFLAYTLTFVALHYLNEINYQIGYGHGLDRNIEVKINQVIIKKLDEMKED